MKNKKWVSSNNVIGYKIRFSKFGQKAILQVVKEVESITNNHPERCKRIKITEDATPMEALEFMSNLIEDDK